MSKQPMLSITFMTPGKKKTLEMCLESIKWMQQDFPCELVIVDTGCDAEHRALIEGYADKIVDFTWINDFAAARNAGIAACSGEWFMIMDDDEVIKDYKPLKEFFESGDYKNHQWIMTMEHDFTDWEESNYEQYYWTRATRNEPGYRYEGKIHEYLVGPTTPALAIPAVFGHYGYIFDTDEQLMEHAKRNITLLEAALKEQPKNVHAAIQLAQEYHVIKEREKKEDICKKYYPVARDAVKPSDRAWKDSLYCGWVDAIFAGGNDEATLAMVCRGLLEEPIAEEAKGFLYCIATHTCFRAKKYADCVNYGCQYITSYDKCAKYVEVSGAMFFIKTAYESIQYSLVVQCILLSAVLTGNDKLLFECVDLLDWADEKLELHEGIGEVMKQALKEDFMQTLAVKFLDAVLPIKRVREVLVPSMESLECDFVPLYLRLSDVALILQYLKRESFERLQTLYSKNDVLTLLSEWQCAKLYMNWALLDFLNGDVNAVSTFVDAGSKYFPKKYTIEALDEEICISHEAILWKVMLDAYTLEQNQQPQNAIRRAKDAMGICSEYDHAIAAWIHTVADKVSHSTKNTSAEMALLGQQVKGQARALIDAGDFNSAQSILLQLRNLLPDDEEIQKMLSECL